jgi:hypothetical protein
MNVRCKGCGNKVVQKSDQGVRVRTQGPLVFTSEGHCVGQCFWCKGSVELPLELTKAYTAPTERLVIVERLKSMNQDNET